MTSSERPRIEPLPEAELTDEQRELLAGIGGLGPEATLGIFSTLVRHPKLFRRWLPFGGKLLSGVLPARDRELLILRTAYNCRSVYEWAQHVRIGKACGLTDDEIGRIPDGPEAWDGPSATLLSAADELHQTSHLSDAAWAGLAEMYDEQQLIEVPMLIGHYHLVAFTLNSMGVALEPGTDPAGADQWDLP